MHQSEQINELAEALAKAQGEIENAGRSATNPHFQKTYADLASIREVIREPLARHHLAYWQVTDIVEGGRMVLVTTLAHKSGQWVRSFYPIQPVRNDPQGVGSAITYAKRYSLAAITGVAAAGEDDDGNAASNRDEQAKPAPRQQPKGPSPFASAGEREAFCDNATLSYQNADTLEALSELAALHKDTLDRMKTSASADDRDAVAALRKHYGTAGTRIKAAAVMAEPRGTPAEPPLADPAADHVEAYLKV